MQMPQISRGRAPAYLLAVLVVVAIGGKLFLDGGSPPSAERGFEGRNAASSNAFIAEPAAPKRLVVDVVGAVRRPGLYELADGSRVDDAIRKAGGPKPKAALEQINLAAPVADGAQIVVPVRTAAASPTGEPAAGATGPDGPVHLNTATLEDLDGLPGVGPVTAQRILDYRDEHGAFRSVDELDAVPGIGPARLEQLRELVQL
jgi:competence protein ComEA